MTIIKKRQELPVFGDVMANLFDDNFFAPIHSKSAHKRIPSVNIFEDDTNYTIQLAAPGMKKDDFNIDLNNKTLTISSEQKSEKTETEERYTLREFNYTAFSRAFTIPKNGDVENISAGYSDGILEVKIAKKEKEPVTNKKISIS